MSSLYELTSDYVNLLAMAEDPDTPDDVFKDTLEGLDGEIEQKADGYARVLTQLAVDANAIKAEEDRLKSRRKSIENRIDKMKQSLKLSMRETGKTKFKTEFFSFNLRKNAPSVVLDVSDIDSIPDWYLIPQPPKVDKAHLKDDLKRGVELTGVAHLEQSESVVIK